MLITWMFRATGQIPEPLWKSVDSYLPAVGERVLTKSVDGMTTTLEVKEVYRIVQFSETKTGLGMSAYEYEHTPLTHSDQSVETKGTVILERANYRLP